MSGFVSREDKLSSDLGFDSGSDDDGSGARPIDARRSTSAAKAPAPPPLGIARAVAGSGFGNANQQQSSHLGDGGSQGSAADAKAIAELEKAVAELIEQKAQLEARLKSSEDARVNTDTRFALFNRSISVRPSDVLST